MSEGLERLERVSFGALEVDGGKVESQVSHARPLEGSADIYI